MFKLLFLSLFIAPVSFYSLSVNDIDGNTLNLDSFHGKKILIVNISTDIIDSTQMIQLEELYEQHQDSLVVIGVPSNSFGNTSVDGEDIKARIVSQFNIHFIIAAKQDVTGEHISPLYTWLTQIEQNGMIQGDVKNDFQKFLINENGLLVGVFMPSVQPTSEEMSNALNQQYN